MQKFRLIISFYNNRHLILLKNWLILILIVLSNQSALAQLTMRQFYGDDRQILGLSNGEHRNINLRDGTYLQNEKRSTLFLMFPVIANGESKWWRCSGAIVFK